MCTGTMSLQDMFYASASVFMILCTVTVIVLVAAVLPVIRKLDAAVNHLERTADSMEQQPTVVQSIVLPLLFKGLKRFM